MKTVTLLLWILAGTAVIGIAGLLFFRNWLIIELGLIVFAVDFVFEYIGTQKGWWSYKKIGPVVGKLPLHVPLTYFFLGMATTTYLLWRLGF